MASMTNQFAVTWDYRCPFARNAHEHLIAGLKAGANWDVTFLPFSLTQAHVEEGQPSGWDEPEKDTGLVALMIGVGMGSASGGDGRGRRRDRVIIAAVLVWRRAR